MKWSNIDLGYKDNLSSLQKKDCFELLGIEKDATLKEAKSAYKKMVLLYHPDRTDAFMSTYSEEVIKLLNDAIDKIKVLKKNE